MGPRSLSTRLLASVSILLIVFFGITIAALDFAYRHRSRLRRAAAVRSTTVPPAPSRRRLAGARLESHHRMGIRQRRDADLRVQRRRGSPAVLRAAQSIPRSAVRLVRFVDVV